jgi:glycosyltransferase involved in cell wall biosynthesis
METWEINYKNINILTTIMELNAVSEIKRGIALVHYNRPAYLREVAESIQDTMPEGTKLVVCDDGSEFDVGSQLPKGTLLIKGPNKGVAANKNRALWALQDCHFISIIEDDLLPVEKGWFEIYEKAVCITEEHHFCRVQDKELQETVPKFTEFLAKFSYTPIYGPTPRGDFTFLTSEVVRQVGAFNPLFKGAGYAHGEWSNRVVKSGLLNHPLKWMDITEARDKFKQIGDTEGGRWSDSKQKVDHQIKKNSEIRKKLDSTSYTYHPLILE